MLITENNLRRIVAEEYQKLMEEEGGVKAPNAQFNFWYRNMPDQEWEIKSVKFYCPNPQKLMSNPQAGFAEYKDKIVSVAKNYDHYLQVGLKSGGYYGIRDEEKRKEAYGRAVEYAVKAAPYQAPDINMSREDIAIASHFSAPMWAGIGRPASAAKYEELLKPKKKGALVLLAKNLFTEIGGDPGEAPSSDESLPTAKPRDDGNVLHYDRSSEDTHTYRAPRGSAAGDRFISTPHADAADRRKGK